MGIERIRTEFAQRRKEVGPMAANAVRLIIGRAGAKAICPNRTSPGLECLVPVTFRRRQGHRSE